jgi:hypothetical protein
MISTTPPRVLTTTQISSTVTTLQTTLPDRKTNIMKLLEESFPSSAAADDLQFGEIFSASSATNPWAIDTAQFEIVPAVPSQNAPVIAQEVSEDSRKKTDLVKQNHVPRQFSPVPAVPVVTAAPGDKIARQPKNKLRTSDVDDNQLEEEKVAIETLNKNGICLEKCVQQFCIPEEDLSMFSNCVDKYKTLCL